MDNFNLKEYLVKNKLTNTSKRVAETLKEAPQPAPSPTPTPTPTPTKPGRPSPTPKPGRRITPAPGTRPVPKMKSGSSKSGGGMIKKIIQRLRQLSER